MTDLEPCLVGLLNLLVELTAVVGELVYGDDERLALIRAALDRDPSLSANALALQTGGRRADTLRLIRIVRAGSPRYPQAPAANHNDPEGAA